MLSRRSAWFLLLAGVFQWVVWPTFLKNIWADPRSFDNGPTAFLVVHAVLTAAQLVLATVLLVLGARGLRGRTDHRRRPAQTFRRGGRSGPA